MRRIIKNHNVLLACTNETQVFSIGLFRKVKHLYVQWRSKSLWGAGSTVTWGPLLLRPQRLTLPKVLKVGLWGGPVTGPGVRCKLLQPPRCFLCSRMTSPVTDKKLSYRRGTARCVVSIEILPIATQQCRNYLYDKS